MASLDSIGGIHYEMMKRCYNKNSVAFKDYGAKGICVCEEWHNRDKFRKWAKENGYVKGMRLERINGKEDYRPDNCRFGEKLKKKSGIAAYTREIRMHRKTEKEISNIRGNYSKTRIYRIYQSMHSRCEDKTYSYYENYGGRGITVCNEWSGKDGFFHFYRWSMKNGYDERLTIDRKDNDKGYSPKNCRWATMKEQVRNRRNSIWIKYNGEDLTLSDIAEINNVKYQSLYSRVIQKGMDIFDAINDIKEKN